MLIPFNFLEKKEFEKCYLRSAGRCKILAAFIKELEHNQYDTYTYAFIMKVCRMHITN